jgi:uroporphyrinogen-III synthase
MHGDVLIFTSPAAVRFAARLLRLRTQAAVMAIGSGSARALARCGIEHVLVPPGCATSEGLLEHPRLADVRGQRIALIGARGGRDLLAPTLRDRGARVREVYVYRREPARLSRRHFEAVEALPAASYVLLSSVETLQQLQRSLQGVAWRRLIQCVAVVSSERMERAARKAGFTHLRRAASAVPDDLLAAAVTGHAASGARAGALPPVSDSS